MSAPVLEARDLVLARGGRDVLAVQELAVRDGESLVLLGPNGSGKTTLLQALALLHPPRRGTISFRGSPVDAHSDPVALRRRMAVVFQQPLLLDRTVVENVELGLALRGVPAPRRRERAATALRRLGIASLATRRARGLSGGESQRVSLARALALDPEVLFLDEPFAALDAPTREVLVADVSRLLRESRTTSVIVTHDRDEALTLADRIAVLLEGGIRQIAAPDVVFGSPADTAVANFVGVETVLPARVIEVAEEITRLRVADHVVEVTALPPGGDAFPLLLIAPGDVVIARPSEHAGSARNRFPGRVVRLEPVGRAMRVVLDCGFPLVAHLTRASVRELELAPGVEIAASFKATAPHLLARRRGLHSRT